MIDHDSSRVLDELGHLVPDRRPSLPDLMAMARAAKRGRDRRRNALAVAIAGATVVSAALLYPHLPDSASRDVVASSGDTPVITMSESLDDFPQAEVNGTLTLAAGCLLLDNSPVFWPFGTTWDSETRAVVFPDDFDTPPLEVGANFIGSGGYYTATQASDILGPQGGESLSICATKSGSRNRVIYAVPSSD